MNSIHNPIDKVLARIAELQARTSPVTLTIGGTSPIGTVAHDVITIRQAPPAVVTAIVNEFGFVSLTPDGLQVPVTREG